MKVPCVIPSTVQLHIGIIRMFFVLLPSISLAIFSNEGVTWDIILCHYSSWDFFLCCQWLISRNIYLSIVGWLIVCSYAHWLLSQVHALVTSFLLRAILLMSGSSFVWPPCSPCMAFAKTSRVGCQSMPTSCPLRKDWCANKQPQSDVKSSLLSNSREGCAHSKKHMQITWNWECTFESEIRFLNVAPFRRLTCM